MMAAACGLFPALQADTLFKPRAMRDAEKAALASSLGPIRVRLHFPDATIIQASFAASQPLSAVLQLVTQIALESAAPALYLYTTPPKTVLKDMTATLYQLGLVPAAHLYVGCEPKKLKASVATSITGEGLTVQLRYWLDHGSRVFGTLRLFATCAGCHKLLSCAIKCYVHQSHAKVRL
jgi:hypothetical protein